jgi:hypothetical protein
VLELAHVPIEVANHPCAESIDRFGGEQAPDTIDARDQRCRPDRLRIGDVKAEGRNLEGKAEALLLKEKAVAIDRAHSGT